MTQKLWVDYTNHRGDRRWREIDYIENVGYQDYPPHITASVQRRTLCLDAKLADREDRRTLALTSCHAFHEGDTPPSVETDKVEKRLIDRLSTDEVEKRLVDLHNRVTALEKENESTEVDVDKLQAELEELIGAKVERVGETSMGTIFARAAEKNMASDVKPEPMPTKPLTFIDLAYANVKRQKEWDKTTALVGTLGTLYRANELAGEVGEVCNKIKKLVREQLKIAGSRTILPEIADELADVVICCDLLAQDLGIALAPAVRSKFNATSVERNLATRL